MSIESFGQSREQEIVGRGIQSVLDSYPTAPSQTVSPPEAVAEKLPILEIERTEIFAHFQISLVKNGKLTPAWVVLLKSDTYFEAHILEQEPSLRNNPIDTNLEDLSHAALRIDQNIIPSKYSQLKIGNRSFTIAGSLPAVILHNSKFPVVKERVGVNSARKSEPQKTVLFTTENRRRTEKNVVDIEHSQQHYQLNVPDTLASIASLQFPSQDSNGTTSFFMPFCNKGEIEALLLIESRHIVAPGDDQLEVPLYVLEDIFRKLTGYQDPQPDPQDVHEMDDDDGQDKRADKSTEARKPSIWQRVQGIFESPVNIDHYNLSPDVNDASQQPKPEPEPSLPVKQKMGWKRLSNLSDTYLEIHYPDEASAYGKKQAKEIKIPEKRESNQPFVLESLFELPGIMCDLYLSGVDARNVSLRLVYRDVASRPSLKLRHTTIGAIRPEANVTLENALKAELTTAGSSHYLTVGKQAAKEQLLQSFPLAWSSVETEIIITLPTRFQRISDEYHNQQMSLTLKGEFENLTQQSTNPPLNLRELHLNPTNAKAAIRLNNWGRVWCQNPDQIKSLSTTGCHFVVIEGGTVDLTAVSYGTVISNGIVGKASMIGKNAVDSCYTSAGILKSLDATNTSVDIFVLSPVGPEDLVLSNCQGVVQLVSSDMDPSAKWYTDLNYEIATVELGDIRFVRHRKTGLMKIAIAREPKSKTRRVAEIIAALNR